VDSGRCAHLENLRQKENTGGKHCPIPETNRGGYSAKGVQPWGVPRFSCLMLVPNFTEARVKQFLGFRSQMSHLPTISDTRAPAILGTRPIRSTGVKPRRSAGLFIFAPPTPPSQRLWIGPFPASRPKSMSLRSEPSLDSLAKMIRVLVSDGRHAPALSVLSDEASNARRKTLLRGVPG
jgi:hypothetical protein